MNNINYLLSRILRGIPKQLLNRAFPNPVAISVNKITIPLEERIRLAVIDNCLLLDCNIIGGTETVVDVSSIPAEQTDAGVIIRIGFGPTAGKLITSVLGISYGFAITQTLTATIASTLAAPPLVSDSRVQVMGQNVIFIEGYLPSRITHVRCIVENSAGFSNIQQRALLVLGDLAVLAAKMIIYNNLIIELGTGVITSGVDTPKMTELVESYADSATMYFEMIGSTWKKVNIMQDKVSHNRLIRSVVGGGR